MTRKTKIKLARLKALKKAHRALAKKRRAEAKQKLGQILRGQMANSVNTIAEMYPTEEIMSGAPGGITKFITNLGDLQQNLLISRRKLREAIEAVQLAKTAEIDAARAVTRASVELKTATEMALDGES